jgi:hypothetical protein
MADEITDWDALKAVNESEGGSLLTDEVAKNLSATKEAALESLEDAEQRGHLIRDGDRWTVTEDGRRIDDSRLYS